MKEHYHSNPPPFGRGWGWLFLVPPNITTLFFVFLPDKGIS